MSPAVPGGELGVTGLGSLQDKGTSEVGQQGEEDEEEEGEDEAAVQQAHPRYQFFTGESLGGFYSVILR